MSLPPLPFSIDQKTVLISPLNWGLGHAARTTVIINELLKNNASVIIAGGGKSAKLLQSEFPNLPFLHLQSHEICYDSSGMSIVSLIKQLPKLIYQTINEYYSVKKLIKKHNVELIISDNRYGLRNKNRYSIIICHQLTLFPPQKIRFLKTALLFIHKLLLRQFDECWVPDYQNFNESLAGELSHPKKTLHSKIQYIKPLSNKKQYSQTQETIIYDILILLSGPEPQRTIFESLLVSTLTNSKLLIALVRGTTEATDFEHKFAFIQSIAKGMEISKLMSQSKLIISRSGYSSIMDIHCMNKAAIIIPTPQQSEQEYLAKYLSNREKFRTIEQNKIESQLNNVIKTMLEDRI